MIMRLWAKWKHEQPEAYYPLLFHMVDAAAVTRELWHSSLQEGTRHFFANKLELSEDDTCAWISFWAGLHDIGKASPGFQGRSDYIHNVLCKDFDFSATGLNNMGNHGYITAEVLPELLKKYDVASEMSKRVATTIGGHHGVFPRSMDLAQLRNVDRYLGASPWRKVRSELFCTIGRICGIEKLASPANTINNPFFMFLAGLTSVADWIASNKDFFPYTDWETQSLEEHCDIASKQAQKAINALAWVGWRPPREKRSFKKLFPKIETPWPLQDKIEEMAEGMGKSPCMVIIEAPTGEGKTEAAMYMADYWAAKLKQRGCYFALPTQATSNQMFGRVKEFLEESYPEQQLLLMLLHGHAALSAEFSGLLERGKQPFEVQNIEGEDGYDGAKAQVVASEWFTYRKKGLLAPFGVGTIDQALLAVLQTRHVFVRLFGLANKTIIVDEVHAYDAYMTRLLERLLEWLASLNCSVVMLSATLPRERRLKLLRAYNTGRGIDTDQSEDAPYPRMSWTSGQGNRAAHVDAAVKRIRTIQLRWVNGGLSSADKEFPLGNELQRALSNGGCAAVICNTVKQAQDIYCALKPYFPVQDAGDGYPELDLFHARYLFAEREKREKRTLCRFGKEGEMVDYGIEGVKKVKRPKRAVVVATQVIEQSLDLDFDLMATEMAPVDLLLQRAGRLWRHESRNRYGISSNPPLWIFQPQYDENGIPEFGSGTEYIYDSHILLRSWLALFGVLDIKDSNEVDRLLASRNLRDIGVPEDVDRLIEAVYGERGCPAIFPQALQERWNDSRRKLQENLHHQGMEARERVLKGPFDNGKLWHLTADSREEDDPTIHVAHQALTRLTGISMSVICLYKSNKGIFLDEKRTQAINIEQKPDIKTTKKLLRGSMVVSNYKLAKSLCEEGCSPKTWQKSILLRHHRLLINEDSYWTIYNGGEGYPITDTEMNISVDAELGMRVS